MQIKGTNTEQSVKCKGSKICSEFAAWGRGPTDSNVVCRTLLTLSRPHQTKIQPKQAQPVGLLVLVKVLIAASWLLPHLPHALRPLSSSCWPTSCWTLGGNVIPCQCKEKLYKYWWTQWSWNHRGVTTQNLSWWARWSTHMCGVKEPCRNLRAENIAACAQPLFISYPTLLPRMKTSFLCHRNLQHSKAALTSALTRFTWQQAGWDRQTQNIKVACSGTAKNLRCTKCRVIWEGQPAATKQMFWSYTVTLEVTAKKGERSTNLKWKSHIINRKNDQLIEVGCTNIAWFQRKYPIFMQVTCEQIPKSICHVFETGRP